MKILNILWPPFPKPLPPEEHDQVLHLFRMREVNETWNSRLFIIAQGFILLGVIVHWTSFLFVGLFFAMAGTAFAIRAGSISDAAKVAGDVVLRKMAKDAVEKLK